MTLSDKGLIFIQGWEEFRPKAYKDQAGIWTIGYGTIIYHSGKRVKKGDIISVSKALYELDIEIASMVKKLNIYISVPIRQHVFDSLVSLAYNIGTQGFRTSTLLRELNKNRIIKEDYFTRWNKITVDGKKVPSKGLTRRRRTEWALFSKADYTGNSGV